MAAAAYHHPSSSSADPNAAYSAAMAHQQHQQQHQQQQHAAASTGTATSQQPTSLRRAVYVHISDLTSAYNIDHAMLEEELTRVKREAAAAAAGVARKGDDPSRGGGGGASASSASGAVSTIASGAAATTASASLGGVPTELDTNPSQKRLHPPRAGYNLCVLVGKVSVVVDKRRVDGSRVRLAEVEVGDETGVVSLRARDEQIDTLEEVSGRAGAVVIRNCTLELYQGRHMRLAVTKWGKLARYPDQIASTPPPPSKINRDRNFSLIDLSKVASEMVSYPTPSAADPYHQQQHQQHHHHPSGGHHQEAENHANRSQTYSNAGRRGRRPPTTFSAAGSGRPKPSLGGHYGHDPTSAGLQGPANPGAYPATGLHGYGGIEASPYLYPPRQADNLVPSQQQHHQQQLRHQQQQQQQQQQHMMMHQQYDLQTHHRPMHQAPPPPPPPPPPPAHMAGGGYPQDRMGGPPPTMMNPELVAPATASGFDPNPFGMSANPFLSPMSPPPHHSAASGAMPTTLSSSSSSGGAGVIRADSPHGKMNPQAATFDPVAFRK